MTWSYGCFVRMPVYRLDRGRKIPEEEVCEVIAQGNAVKAAGI